MSVFQIKNKNRTISPYKLKAVQLSDIGYHRTKNEDSVGICEKIYESIPVGLYVVCDGVGGGADGEIASARAVDELINSFFKNGREFFNSYKSDLAELSVKLLESAILDANFVVYTKQQQKTILTGYSATTLTCLAVVDRTFIFGNAGDSRGYLMRKGKLEQVTEDHNQAYMQYKDGKITKEEMLKSPYKNCLSNCLGSYMNSFWCDTYVREAQMGDVALLCSDGLCGMLTDYEIEACMSMGTLEEKAHFLVEAALDAGGHDNITVALVELN